MHLSPRVKDRHMEALIVHLEKDKVPETKVHEGEEFIHILKGQAVLQLGQELFKLDPGDSAYY